MKMRKKRQNIFDIICPKFVALRQHLLGKRTFMDKYELMCSTIDKLN